MDEIFNLEDLIIKKNVNAWLPHKATDGIIFSIIPGQYFKHKFTHGKYGLGKAKQDIYLDAQATSFFRY